MKTKKENIFENNQNEDHDPPTILEALQLKPGWVLLHRPKKPSEEKIGKIVRPDGEQVAHTKDPNCAVVVKVGADCTIEVGDYAVWAYGTEFKQPVPVVPNFMDYEPSYYCAKESWLMAVLKK